MSFDLVIEHDDGTTDTLSILGSDSAGDASLPSLVTLEISEKLRRKPEGTDEAEVIVWRDAWADIEDDIDRTNDKITIEENGSAIFGGRFRDWQYEDVVVSVLLDGPKRDAIDAKPSGGNDIFAPQDDSSIVSSILGRVDTISEGTVNTVTSGIPFSESQASPAKSLTKLARDAGADIDYNPDFSVDYIDRLGADQNTTLSPSNGNVEGEPRIREKVREDVTHVKVLGSKEGTAQISSQKTAPSYSSSDRAVWRLHVDKEIQQQSRADELADKLVTEYDGNTEFLEVELDIPTSVDPSLGDSFTVTLPDYNIDQKMKIVELRRLINEAGDRFRAILSNRDRTRELEGEQNQRTINEFREGNAGQYYALSDGEGWDAVDSGEAYEFTVFRPQDTISELRAKLQLESREYRLRAAQTGHSHDVAIDATTADNADFQAVVEDSAPTSTATLDGGWTTLHSETVNENTSMLMVYYRIENESSNDIRVFSRYVNNATGYAFGEFNEAQLAPGEAHTLIALDPTDVNGQDWIVEATLGFNSAPSDVTSRLWYQAIGKHNHDVSKTETSDSVVAVDPGIVTQSNEQVSNVAVGIDGTTVASGLSAPIDTTIDITGELSDGNNDITITSDSLGELRATVEYEGIKNASN